MKYPHLASLRYDQVQQRGESVTLDEIGAAHGLAPGELKQHRKNVARRADHSGDFDPDTFRFTVPGNHIFPALFYPNPSPFEIAESDTDNDDTQPVPVAAVRIIPAGYEGAKIDVTQPR